MRISASSSSESLETSCPSRKYRPDVGVSRHPKICIKVDLPEPEGPIIATNSPFSISKLMFLRTGDIISPVLYDLAMSLISIILTRYSISASASVAPDISKNAWRLLGTLTGRRAVYRSYNHLVSLFQPRNNFNESIIGKTGFNYLLSWRNGRRNSLTVFVPRYRLVKYFHVLRFALRFYGANGNKKNILRRIGNDGRAGAHSRFYSIVLNVKGYFYVVSDNTLGDCSDSVNFRHFAYYAAKRRANIMIGQGLFRSGEHIFFLPNIYFFRADVKIVRSFFYFCER